MVLSGGLTFNQFQGPGKQEERAKAYHVPVLVSFQALITRNKPVCMKSFSPIFSSGSENKGRTGLQISCMGKLSNGITNNPKKLRIPRLGKQEVGVSVRTDHLWLLRGRAGRGGCGHTAEGRALELWILSRQTDSSSQCVLLQPEGQS